MSRGLEKKQYRPIPEEPRPGKKSRKSKRFVLERKLKPEHFDPKSLLFRWLKEPLEWHRHGNYEREQDAQRAMACTKTKFYWDRYDYRVVDTKPEMEKAA